MYNLRPRNRRGPPPDPQPATRRATQQPRTGRTTANRGSTQQPRTVENTATRGIYTPGTADQFPTKKCGRVNCKMCSILDTSSTFKSTVTHRIYSVCNLQKPTKKEPFPILTCSTCNTIYLLTCQSCFLQYVGQTIVKISI